MTMNLRSRAIQRALEHVSAAYRDEPLRVLEVGCMYKEDEGLSTYVIADFLAKRRGASKFISVDWDQAHIDACQQIIRRRNPSLNGAIDYRLGHSLSLLPGILADLGTVHFALLDGGEHPEVCLAEFEQVVKHLAPDGALLVDDAQPIPLADDYPLTRPLGKVNLILPMLLIRDYLEHRDALRAAASDPNDPASVPDAQFVNELKGLRLGQDAAFCVMGTWHRMLAYGSPRFVTKAGELSDVGLVRKAVRHLLNRLPFGS
jgi:predicted O-methyltransferase YrrM